MKAPAPSTHEPWMRRERWYQKVPRAEPLPSHVPRGPRLLRPGGAIEAQGPPPGGARAPYVRGGAEGSTSGLVG